MEKKEMVLDELESIAGGKKGVKKQAIIVNCERRCNARSGPSTDYEVVAYAYAGEIYDLYGWSGSWALMKVDGRKVYVHKSKVEEL